MTVRLINVGNNPFLKRQRVECSDCPKYRTLDMREDEAQDELRRHRGFHASEAASLTVVDGGAA